MKNENSRPRAIELSKLKTDNSRDGARVAIQISKLQHESPRESRNCKMKIYTCSPLEGSRDRARVEIEISMLKIENLRLKNEKISD